MDLWFSAANACGTGEAPAVDGGMAARARPRLERGQIPVRDPSQDYPLAGTGASIRILSAGPLEELGTFLLKPCPDQSLTPSTRSLPDRSRETRW